MGLLKNLLHHNKPLPEAIRRRIWRDNGIDYFVPKGSDRAYRLQAGEAAKLVARTELFLEQLQGRMHRLGFLLMPVLVIMFTFGDQLALVPEVQNRLPGIMAALFVIALTTLHFVSNRRFEQQVEEGFIGRASVPLEMLRDPQSERLVPVWISVPATALAVVALGLYFWAAMLPLDQSNALMEKMSGIVHYIHLPLLALVLALSVHIYFKRKRRGF